MKETTKEWLDFAGKDMIACERLVDDPSLTTIVAFHAQQTVEKCFKAFFEEKDLKVPRIHNLLRLYDTVSEFIDFPIDEDELEKLDEVYIETRYPVGAGMLPDGKPSLAVAREFFEFAVYVYQNALKVLGK